MKRIHWLSIGIVLILPLVAVLLRADDESVPPPDKPEVHDVFEVKLADVELRTSATGTIRPKHRTIIPSPITGKVAWVIEEGTFVKKGTEVARVDCAEYSEQLDRLKMDLSYVEAELRRAKFEEQLVKELLEFEVRKGTLNLELARLRHNILTSKPRKTDLKLSELKVSQAKYSLEAARKEYERGKLLGEKGIESGRTIALARLRFERAQADHLKVEAEHQLLKKGEPKENIAVAEQKVKRAETVLTLAKQRLKSLARFQATQVAVARVGVDRVRALAELQQGRIDRSRVTSPVDGVVLFPRQRGMPLMEGDPVWQSNRFLDITTPEEMTVEAVVSQVDWPNVKPGQRTEIKLVAYPDKLFHGVVKKVGTLARDRSLILREEIANVMSFYVMVDIDERAEELKPSYTAKISIITDSIKGGLAVPRNAVFKHAGKDCVWVLSDGDLTLREVVLGRSGSVMIAVKKGLKAGEDIVIPRRSFGETR